MLLSNGWTMTSGLTFTSAAPVPPSGGNLVMTFNTALATTNPGNVYLPLGGGGGTVNATINWGDSSNTETATTAGVYSHTYASNRNYQVTVTGTMSAYGQVFFGTGENEPLVSVDSWDNDLGLTDLQFAFKGAVNLEQVPNTLPSTLQLINYMFEGANSLYSLDLSGWDTSNVTGWDGVFNSAATFNGNISTWDTSKAQSMTNFFYNCYQFNGNISSWNTTNITSMASMFLNANTFNGNLTSWNTSNVTTMDSMFQGATVFNGNISSWNVGNVGNVDQMFKNATNFNRNLSSWTTGLIGQPANFSLGANATFADNASNLKPYLSGGTVRINN